MTCFSSTNSSSVRWVLERQKVWNQTACRENQQRRAPRRFAEGWQDELNRLPHRIAGWRFSRKHRAGKQSGALAAVVCCTALACGLTENTNEPNGDTDSTAGDALNDSTQTGGDTPTPTRDPNCPSVTPSEGAPCDGELSCEYDEVEKSCCTETATALCEDGAWVLRHLECDCPESWGSTCNQHSVCMPKRAACCPSCGVVEASEFYADLVSTGGVDCDDELPCLPCVDVGSKSFTAICGAGDVCEMLDLSAHPVTACETDADCRIRTRSCCECAGTPGSYLALNADEILAYEALVCAAEQACDPCGHEYPTDQAAVCVEGHCELSYHY